MFMEVPEGCKPGQQADVLGQLLTNASNTGRLQGQKLILLQLQIRSAFSFLWTNCLDRCLSRLKPDRTANGSILQTEFISKHVFISVLLGGFCTTECLPSRESLSLLVLTPAHLHSLHQFSSPLG